MTVRVNQSIVVAIAGPDGCGKSTVLKYLDRELQGAAYSVAHEHLRPNWLPSLSALRGKSKKQPEEWDRADRPHAAPQVGALSSCVRWAYYALDYSFGFWLKTRRQVADIILFDRYVDDFMIDPRRSRLRDMPWFLRSFWRALPRPHKTFYLDAPVEVLLSRKQEIEKEQLIQLVEDYRALSARGEHVEIVDAQLAPEVLGQQIFEEIIRLKHA